MAARRLEPLRWEAIGLVHQPEPHEGWSANTVDSRRQNRELLDGDLRAANELTVVPGVVVGIEDDDAARLVARLTHSAQARDFLGTSSSPSGLERLPAEG